MNFWSGVILGSVLTFLTLFYIGLYEDSKKLETLKKETQKLSEEIEVTRQNINKKYKDLCNLGMKEACEMVLN